MAKKIKSPQDFKFEADGKVYQFTKPRFFVKIGSNRKEYTPETACEEEEVCAHLVTIQAGVIEEDKEASAKETAKKEAAAKAAAEKEAAAKAAAKKKAEEEKKKSTPQKPAPAVMKAEKGGEQPTEEGGK